VCPSDTRPKVDVNGTESGTTSIDNTVDENGCSIQDHVNACAAGAKNHGQYVKCIGELAKRLEDDGTITKSHAKEMKTGAAKSSGPPTLVVGGPLSFVRTMQESADAGARRRHVEERRGGGDARAR
jgi:hypothetical protein